MPSLLSAYSTILWNGGARAGCCSYLGWRVEKFSVLGVFRCLLSMKHWPTRSPIWTTFRRGANRSRDRKSLNSFFREFLLVVALKSGLSVFRLTSWKGTKKWGRQPIKETQNIRLKFIRQLWGNASFTSYHTVFTSKLNFLQGDVFVFVTSPDLPSKCIAREKKASGHTLLMLWYVSNAIDASSIFLTATHSSTKWHTQ